MKRYLLFVLVLCSLTNLFSQTDFHPNLIKTEHKKFGSNTYIIEYYNSDYKFYSNEHNPFAGIPPYDSWQYNMKLSVEAKDEPGAIVGKVLKPYFQGRDLPPIYLKVLYDIKGNQEYFKVNYSRKYFKVKGKAKYFVLGISSDVDIPIKIIAKLEKRLKKSIVRLRCRPKTVELVQDVRYVTLERHFTPR